VGLELEGELKRGEIERVVRKLMVDEEGKEIWMRGKNLERIEVCIRDDGASNNSLNELIKMIMSF
jgi:hypothetical protein